MTTKRKYYVQGALWRTRKDIACYGDRIDYIPYAKIVLFLDEYYSSGIEDVKVLYDGNICYIEDVDVAHVFDLNPIVADYENDHRNNKI